MKSLPRRSLFRLIAISLGLLPIAVTGIALRVAGIAADPPRRSPPSLSAIDNDPLIDLHALRPLFVPNSDQTRMEIGSDRMNYFCPASFPIKKAPNAFRVFALGGSTTQGQPYGTETAFPYWLSLRLQVAMPQRGVEVINCGGISYASYRVAAILDEVLKHAPDLIVLYTGHNEFLEARTYERQRRVPRWLARPLAAAGRLRTVRVIAGAFENSETRAVTKTALPAEVDTLLDHADGMDAYVRDPEWIAAVQEHFEQILESMVTRCQASGVPLVICVPAGDLVNTPPFKSQPDPSLPPELRGEVQQLSQVAAAESASIPTRLAAANAILKLDAQHALANYVLGRWAYESGEEDIAVARQRLVAARDYDICPLRATTRIEQVVRSHGSKPNVFLVDTVSLLDRRNRKHEPFPDNIADPSWFVDHVHPNIEGHQEIATAIYTSLSGLMFTPAADAQADYDAKVAEHLKTLGEEYFGRAQQRLDGVNRWSRRLPPASSGQ